MDLDATTLAITYVSVSIQDKIDVQLTQTYTYIPEAQLYVPNKRRLSLDKGVSERNFSFFRGKLSIGKLQSKEIDEVTEKKYLISVTQNSSFSLKAEEKKQAVSYTHLTLPTKA